MNRNQNLVLLAAVIVSGVLSYFTYTSNFSLKSYVRTAVQNDYTSPLSKSWENGWEAERSK